MKLGKGVPSVWPGYVAAVASLVLSLLLLLAILVFAMAQVGSIVAQYKPQIMREALQEELEPKRSNDPQTDKQQQTPSPLPSPSGKERPQQSPQVVPSKVKSQVAFQEIRLIFEAGASELSGPEVTEFQQAFEQVRKPADVAWQVSAAVQDADAVNEKNTYRLMLQIRKMLVWSGVELQRVDLRLNKTATAPEGRDRGDIVITIRPVSRAISKEDKP